MLRRRLRCARTWPRPIRSLTSVITAVVVLVTLPAFGGQAVAEEQKPPLSEGQQALADAKESGQRVEVTGERTERTTVFANPDGYSFTLEESAVPVRVAKPGGGWQEPDATLEKRADGSVGPKAAAAQMKFSDGGSGDPLVSITDQGRTLALDWPGKLPTPVLDGANALYSDVLPDVDLRVTATVEGFQHVLVVKTPQAAQSEELKKLTFGLHSTGLTVRKSATGALFAVDSAGQTVFRAPTAQMWNSAGAQAAGGVRTASAAEAGQPSDPAESAPSGSGLEPGQGDQVALMDVQVSKSALTLVPDTGLIEDTDASEYPLFIDPTVTWGESERTLLRSDGYESYGWGNGDDGLGKGAGHCGTWNGYYCGPGYTQRLYFEFSPSQLKGKQVLDATFRVTEPWAFQCDPRWVDLVRTNNISSSTTWSSRPKELDWMGDRYVSAGRGSLCDPDSPDAPIEFNDNPEETNENLTPTVKDFAAGKFSRLTLEIRAHDESDTSAWKRFKNDAVLAVDFVGVPDLPTSIGLVTGSGTVCARTESDPAIVSDPTPMLSATTQTKSGGESGAQLRVYFDIDDKNADGTWSDTSAGNGDLRPSTGYVGDGVNLKMSWSTLSEGTLYRYRAWTRSYYNGGSSYLSGPSNASTTGWCYFKVDPTAPKAPKITFGNPYKECTADSCLSEGGPGVKGTWSFAPADGDTNNVSYQYTLSSWSTWPTVSGGSPSVSITPEKSGTYTLFARAKDDVGRYGAWSAVDFLVAAGEGPVARYHFDEESGAAVDTATAGTTRHPATLGSGAVRDDRGRRGLITHDLDGEPLATAVTDKGLLLDGSGNAYAVSDEPALETRSSYTVSAWVWVDPSVTSTVSVLSQTPSTASPWTKKYSPFVISYGGGTWSLRAFSTEGTWSREAEAPNASPKGVWTHVAGVHDASAKKVLLYVNGVEVASVDAGSPWSADGSLEIGRVMYGDSYLDNFKGSIDEVSVWQRVLTPAEIADDSRLMTSEGYAGLELVGDWEAAQGSGTTIPDTVSGYGASMTLEGGATLEDGDIVLDGVDDAATVDGPLLDGSGSFTATTAVTLDSEKLAAKNIGYTGAVLSQQSDGGRSWGFWYELTGKDSVLDEETLEERTVPVGTWHFGSLDADGTFSSVVSEEVAAVDSRVRLTGVYDSVSGTISLFMGRNQNGQAKKFTAAIGSGTLAVGKGYANSAWGHHLPARIAEARLFAGAVASSEQIDTFIGD
ncbi:LamG-like jellyroll fold domain-containing protein [Streptomyces sp. AC1-42W]|uniref:LamG-like jellyroll fold domain-containing protein n=1 Tax=Streptomyces sp. AC1-42W TaxID=2218666 RepID=UPI000DACC943|nr:LamG-like jellyroll fold domain-containing protein [Streptomyces sp. AC1-42W]PZT77890.1 LamG domain protein jellyroll fold domain protein [Streptomyces sp. AC1-42W]